MGEDDRQRTLEEADDDTPPATVEQISPLLEALLLMAEGPMPTQVLARAVGAEDDMVDDALRGLADFYDRSGRGFQLRDVGGGWGLATRPELFDALARWVEQGQPNRLTQAGLETLSVIAYLQPVARSRVSAVRGVNVDSAVRTLLARGLVEESGADEDTGASLLCTTDYFLARLGLTSLDELPPLSPHLPDAVELAEELAGLAGPDLVVSETAGADGSGTDDDREDTDG